MSALRLQQFARVPRVGGVKTRLQPVFSAAQACAVHEELMCNTAAQLLASNLGPVELWLDRDEPHRSVDDLLAAGLRGPFLQQGQDLGARMFHALAQGLQRAERVLLTGSDCPELGRDYLQGALAKLDDANVVLGPAEDGGFVLIAGRSLHRDMFRGVSWGGSEVLVQTLGALEAVGLSYELMEMRYDVDRPDDVARWRGAQAR